MSTCLSDSRPCRRSKWGLEVDVEDRQRTWPATSLPCESECVARRNQDSRASISCQLHAILPFYFTLVEPKKAVLFVTIVSTAIPYGWTYPTVFQESLPPLPNPNLETTTYTSIHVTRSIMDMSSALVSFFSRASYCRYLHKS